MRKRVAFLTMEDLGVFQADDELAVGPLAELGVEVLWVPWQNAASMPQVDGAVIRSTWDYHHHLPEFLATMEGVASRTKLANPLELIRWNANKRYLLDLEAAGIPTVPTVLSTGVPNSASLREAALTFGVEELVLKPTVSAGGDRTFRCFWDRADEARAALASTEVMIQPFLERILREGELSAIYFGGEVQFLMRKTPRAGEFRVQEEYGGRLDRIEAIPSYVHDIAIRAISSLRRNPLYARIDLAPDAEGRPLLIELELVEPSLYLRLEALAPLRFAEAIRAWLG